MNRQVENVLNAIACKLLPTEDLLESKEELEDFLTLAKEGEIDCTDEDIADSEKNLARVNRVLARRGR